MPRRVSPCYCVLLGVSFLLLLLSDVFAETTTTRKQPAVMNGTDATTRTTTTTTTTANPTRDGREYRVSPPDSNNTTQSEPTRSTAPKGIGKGSWKAIDIWSADRSTIKRASSAEKVVSSSTTTSTSLMGLFVSNLCFVLVAHFVIAFA